MDTLLEKHTTLRDILGIQSLKRVENTELNVSEKLSPQRSIDQQFVSHEKRNLLEGKLPRENTPILQQVSTVKGYVHLDKQNSQSPDAEIPDDEEKATGHKMDTWMKLYLTLLFFVALVSSSKMALPAPFFPQEAARKGASPTVVGLVFSLYEFVVFAASPLFGRYMTRFGVNWLYIAGMFVSGASTVIFGFLYMCPAGTSFVTLSLVIRGMDALGFSAQGTTFVTILCHYFPNSYASVYAAVCSLTSIGCMLGPPMGSVLYELGGFGLPFFVMGGATLLLQPMLIAMMPEIKDEKDPKVSAQCPRSRSALLLVKSGMVWAGMLGLFMSAVGNVFLQPVLAMHLETYGLTPVMIGMCFALHPILYTVFTPVFGLLTDRFNLKAPLLLISSIGCCVAYSLIGPTPVLGFLPRQIWVVLIGYMILGVSEAGLTIPTAKCLVQGATELGFPSEVSTHGIMAGLNVCGYHGGAFMGPLLAGVLTESMGFGYSTFVISCSYLVTFGIFCSIFGYRHKWGQSSLQEAEETCPLIKHAGCLPCQDLKEEAETVVDGSRDLVDSATAMSLCNAIPSLSEK